MSDDPVIRRVTEAGATHDEREIEAVVEVLRTTRLDLGPRVEEFERQIAELLAKRHGVMVNSGTSALRLAIDLLGCEPGDEVITPVVTFSSDVAPLVQSGIVPAFVDVDPETYQIDVDRIEEMIGPRTRAIVAPNLVGNCPDWDRIRAIADQHGLLVVEDSCDVLDSWLRGTRTGTRADIVATSFARGHAITAGLSGWTTPRGTTSA
jgi:CDP-6-deoxy-D-xylo-4-hexulose-3-dehydrase